MQQLIGTVALDRANEASARLNLQWSRIVAPVTGRVGLRPIDAGNFIAAGNAGGVATITQVAPIDVAFSIPQDRVPEVQQRLAAGATLPVTAWDSGRTRQLDSRQLLDAGQPGRHHDRHRQGQGALRERPAARCSRTSSSTCGCCCARSTPPSSCR